MFGETLQTDPIKEENPAENESDGDSDGSDDSLLDRPRTVSKEALSIEREASLNNNMSANPSEVRRRNSSFIDKDNDDSTEDDEEIHHSSRSRRSRHSRHRQQSGSGSGSLEKRTVKERPLSRSGLQSSFIEESDDESYGGEEENSHTRFRRSQRRASRKFDEEAKSGPAPEENPVLAPMAAISSEELQDAWEKVKAMELLPEPPELKLPSFGPKVPMKTRLHAIQNLISSLEYNYTGTLYFDVNKNRSFKSIANTAKEIIKEGLPIQCLEAVFLGAYLTAGMSNLERFPISFKTTAGSSTHRHIVLGIRHQQQKWGALGLSRCDKLMNKDLKFDSLSELVLDYCREFQKVYHKVVKVNVGFPFSHDIHSSERVEWRVRGFP
ncbi:Hypothetical protein PHPALM_16117 [Phytophthora palmivora]|uniref:Vasohibin-2 n=1 Tax=Phytophthora palmivora TaxID=4796 RepID=A0A2P4XQJ0_9STRA|nr:Hypothetical protein PHPALM_16117 [Phytophthora palmivora]